MNVQRSSLRLISALAFGLVVTAGIACDDEGTKKADAGTGGRGGSAGGTGGATGGRGGSGATGGTTTTGGAGGATGGAGGSTGGAGGATGGSGGSTGGTGGGAPDASPDTMVTVDAPPQVDQMVTPDMASDMAPLPDTSSTVMVNDCNQLNCPALTALAAECNSSEAACTFQSPSETVTNYCHVNGVKKTATTTYSGPDGSNYHIVMPVKKQNGTACYTLEMDGNDNTDIENWTFKAPGGTEVARGEWDKGDDQLTLICGGVRYVIGDIGCPGTDGQPEGQCTAGACTP
jgi:hypothetical protein